VSQLTVPQLVNIITPTQGANYNNLQLKTFGYVTPVPTIIPGGLCKSGGVNNESQILVGYPPASGQVVSATGQIKVWANDEGNPFVAPGEIADTTTDGHVITPGNRTALASDKYLYEPALYIAPQTAETGGTPHFPDYLRGEYNNNPAGGYKFGGPGAPMDPVPAGSKMKEKYTAEFVWDVAKLGLATGTYEAEFVIHDGDRDRGVGCVTIQIQ